MSRYGFTHGLYDTGFIKTAFGIELFGGSLLNETIRDAEAFPHPESEAQFAGFTRVLRGAGVPLATYAATQPAEAINLNSLAGPILTNGGLFVVATNTTLDTEPRGRSASFVWCLSKR